MIKVQIDGGLGNQLFQFWSAQILAQNLDVALLLDIKNYYKYRKGFTKRKFELRKLVDETYNCKIGSRFNPPLLEVSSNFIEVNDSQDGLLPKLNATSNFELIGYWQNYLNIIDQREFIRQRMSMVYETRFAHSISLKRNTLAVHVRRGDYANNPKVNSVFGTLPSEYFLNAFQMVSDSHEIEEVLVVSEDLEWCKNNLKFKFNTCFYESKSMKPLELLYLLTKAQHFILSNSSFSWWAAFLGEKPESSVFLPGKWSKSDRIKTDRFLLPRWNSITYSLN